MTTQKTFLQHPIGFWFIFWGELAERAAFYGMRAILALFLVDVMHFSDGRAGMTASLFSAGAYLMCLFGGWISDKYLGKFWTIIVFAIPYLIGYPLLAGVQHGDEQMLFIGLALLALGSGVIKPNLSPLMGALYIDKPDTLKAQAFSWFYMAINLGAGITSVVTPLVRTHFGFASAFYSVAAIMFVAFMVFLLGKSYYPKEEMRPIKKPEVDTGPLGEWERSFQRKKLLRVLGIFGMLLFFVTMFEQTMTTWVFFTRDHVILKTSLFTLDPDQLQALNPWMIIILAPILNLVWKKSNTVKTTTKMKIGFFITTGCMALMSLAGFLSQSEKVSLWWIVAAYILLTLAELCTLMIALQFANDEAPAHMKARMTSFLMLTIFLGAFLAGFFSQFYPEMAPANYFGRMTLVMIIASIVFWFVARGFERYKASLKT